MELKKTKEIKKKTKELQRKKVMIWKWQSFNWNLKLWSLNNMWNLQSQPLRKQNQTLAFKEDNRSQNKKV